MTFIERALNYLVGRLLLLEELTVVNGQVCLTPASEQNEQVQDEREILAWLRDRTREELAKA